MPNYNPEALALLDQTNGFLTEEMTKIPLGDARKLITEWLNMFQTVGDPQYGPLATELARLLELISSDDIDGAAVDSSISGISSCTQKVYNDLPEEEPDPEGDEDPEAPSAGRPRRGVSRTLRKLYYMNHSTIG